MNNDLISREALKAEFKTIYHIAETMEELAINMEDAIDNAPTVEQPIGEWNPVKTRAVEDDEEWEEIKRLWGVDDDMREDFCVFDCPMPEDGQEILITTHWGVEQDISHHDEGYWLEGRDDWDEVVAWMPSPEPYKKGGEGR